VDVVIQLIPVQFEQPDIFYIVSSMLEKYNLSPSRLILEVTESTALKNLDRSIELLNALLKRGSPSRLMILGLAIQTC
jgi:EAL domain-containing protein (putative c-di-GMP-specific phosphodiesterase class I)